MIYDIIYSLLILIEKLEFFNKPLLRVYYVLKSSFRSQDIYIFV